MREATLQNASMKSSSPRVRNALLMHGDTPDNRDVVEQFKDAALVDPPIAVERVRSPAGTHVRATSSPGRVMCRARDGALACVTARPAAAGAVIG